MRIDALDVPGNLVRPHTREHQGVFSFVAYGPEVEALLQERYGRAGLCLKVFKNSEGLSAFDFHWGQGAALVECTRAQNCLAFYDLSPRVYGLERLPDDRLAQVTDFCQGDGEWTGAGMREAKARFGLRTSWDMNPKNWVGGKLVDVQPWHFTDPQGYLEGLVGRMYKYAAWGSRSEPYQSVDELALVGQRDTPSRSAAMRLEEIAWNGMDVLDLGCNLGVTGWEFLRRGARRVVGADLPHVADVARELANWVGYWNADLLGLRLPAERARIAELSGLERFDVVLALSVDRQIGYDRWMADLCRPGGVFFLEGHVPDKEETYRERLEVDFSRVEFLGATRDHGPRPLFRCWK